MKAPRTLRVALFAVAALLLASCQYGPWGPGGSNVVVPDQPNLTTPASAAPQPFGTRTCGESGDATDLTCWMLNTGTQGYARLYGTAYTITDAIHPTPTADPNLTITCGTPGSEVVLDMYATSTTVTNGTCSGSLPTNGSLSHALVYGCVNVHAGGVTLTDDYFIDSEPSCKTGGDGAGDPGVIELGSGNVSHLSSPAALIYDTVDMTGSGNGGASGNEFGIGTVDYTCLSCQTFGGVHPFWIDGGTTRVQIHDSIAPRTTSGNVPSGCNPNASPTNCYHTEDLFIWGATDSVPLDHDWFSVDDGTSSDPRYTTQAISAAVFENATDVGLHLTDSYLDGGTNADYKGTCTSSGMDGEGNSLAKTQTYVSVWGYSSEFVGWQSSNTWGATEANHSADGTVNPVSTPGC